MACLPGKRKAAAVRRGLHHAQVEITSILPTGDDEVVIPELLVLHSPPVAGIGQALVEGRVVGFFRRNLQGFQFDAVVVGPPEVSARRLGGRFEELARNAELQSGNGVLVGFKTDPFDKV